MISKRQLPLMAGLLACILAGPAPAKDRPFLDSVDPMQETRDRAGEYVWKESEVELPAFPTEQGLLEFDVDKVDDPFRYFIDTASLELSDDQVLRYTLVIRSERGGENILYEGMRCATAEYKIYAFGSPKRMTFQRAAPDTPWKDIMAERQQRHHRDLFDFYLCLHNTPREKEEILQAITSPRPTRMEEFYAE